MPEALVKQPMKNLNHSIQSTSHRNITDSLMRYAEFLGYGDIHVKIDKETGLKAIVAINNLKRGPAIGGCRMIPYKSVAHAYEDAIRLGYMMSYKAAINDLPHGGAKSVIIKPKVIKNREALFERFGDFVNELGGRYITAVDSGTSPAEMDIIAKRTKFVTCTTKSGHDDPSPYTAYGVLRGIQAAVKFKLGRDDVEGLRIAVQGAGHVGYSLAKQLKELGAKIIIADVNLKAIQRCIDDFDAEVVAPEEIYSVEADIFAPCALGAILNMRNIKQLKASIVAGSANNQLSHSHYGALLHERDILYAPDFLINAGGLIQVAVAYDNGNNERTMRQIGEIYEKVYNIFERSARENVPTNQIAEQIAREKLK